MEQQIELALRPGTFIYDRVCISFVRGLEEVAAKIGRVSTTEPVSGVALYEAFLAGCHEKIEELDDSSGSFVQFVQDLICLWIKARQGSVADPHETASTLLAWMDDDPYAFCYQIEKDAAAAFDKAGLTAFEKQIRARFEATGSAEPSDYDYKRWSNALRAIYLAQRNIAAYVALAGQTGLMPQDCLALGKLLATRSPDKALVWVEHGLALDRKSKVRYTAAYDLDHLQRELLTKLGRHDEALEAAWADFREHPSKYSYDDLMKFVPNATRPEWHEKALDAAKSADLHSLLDLFVETKEIDRLAELVRGVTDQALEDVSHYATEAAAKKLERVHPGRAARLWRAQGMRIVDAKQSKYYDAALSNFERARDCYRRAGLAAEWDETVRQVRAAHYRKTGFIGAFEAVAAGAKQSEQPSFLERAKARWGKRHGSHNA
jgi:tetratricopeptide (TPR) repeat protein